MEFYPQTGRPLLPQAVVIPYGEAINPNSRPVSGSVLSTSSPAINRSRSARKSQAEWNQIKPLFVEYYVNRGCSLKDTKKILCDEHGFLAT